MYEQGKLLINFASLFLTPEAAIPYLSKLLTGAGKYLDDLMEFMRDMTKSPDLLETDIKKLIAADPDLAIAWNKLRNLGCPIAFDDGDGSIRNKTDREKCEALLAKAGKLATDKEGKKRLKNLVLDTENDHAFFLTLQNNAPLLDNWVYLSGLASANKQWVRKNVDLLKRMTGLTDKQKKALAKIYNRIKIKYPPGINKPPFDIIKTAQELNLPHPPFPADIKVHYNKFGFPDFKDYMPTPRDKYKFDKDDYAKSGITKLEGRQPDFKNANNKVAEKFGCKENSECLDDNFIWDGKSQNFEIKQGDKLVKYTWHHHQDGKTLIPIPAAINNFIKKTDTGFDHTGGGKLIKSDLIGFFDSPDLGN